MGSSLGGRDLEFGVATWKSHCVQKRGRDMKLMSRPGLGVATWLGTGQEKRCRDPILRSRPGVA